MKRDTKTTRRMESGDSSPQERAAFETCLDQPAEPVDPRFAQLLAKLDAREETERPDWLVEVLDEIGQDDDGDWLARALHAIDGTPTTETNSPTCVAVTTEGQFPDTMPDGQPWPRFLATPELRAKFLAESRRTETHGRVPSLASIAAERVTGPTAWVSEWSRSPEDAKAMMEHIRECHERGEVAVCDDKLGVEQ